jgi:serine acetyltransferase
MVLKGRANVDIQPETLMMWPLPWGLNLVERINSRRRGLWIKLRLRAIGGRVGKRLSIGRGVRIDTARGATWSIGDRVSFGTGVILSVGKAASLTIGNDVRITHYTLIAVENSMSIEDRAQIGEHSSLRDHEHDAAAHSMHAAPVICSSVSIGEDSWVGRGVAVLKGSQIGPGAIVGANAVVRGNIPKDAVAVGVPARIVRIRR